MPKWITVASKADIAENASKAVEVGDVSVLLVNKGGEIFALYNVCTHMDYALDEGEIDGETVTCPLHGAKFAIETGEVRAMPAARGLKTFAVNQEGDAVQLDLEEIEAF